VYKKYVAANPQIIEDSAFWGKAFLLLIPVAIVAQIVIHIIFAIVNKVVYDEEIPSINDERDKLIELKSIRISHWIFLTGFMLAMASQAVSWPDWLMFATLAGSGFIASMAAEIARIIYYKRGF
jgi:nitrogen fixation-related uncharacterized protein